MSFPRQIFEFLKAASIAHAKWDYEVSMNIIKNRKKLLILFLLLLPILAVTFSEAAEILGGKKAYAPAFYTTTIFLVSIAVGLAAGLITGCIGAGGGFIITPALMAAGVKGILAVGTDLFHIFAKAIMGTTVHKKLGNVSDVVDGETMVGGGSLPGNVLPTRILSIQAKNRTGFIGHKIAQRLRQCNPPVIGRVSDDVLFLDPRSVLPEDDSTMLSALTEAIAAIG